MAAYFDGRDEGSAPQAVRLNDGARDALLVEHFADGRPPAEHRRRIAAEVPVAFEFDGIAYAVMMATPTDLHDFALGFAVAEGLIGPGENFTGFDAAQLHFEAPCSSQAIRPAEGWVVRAGLPGGGPSIMMERKRMRVGDSSCGLCGVETLESLAKPLPSVRGPLTLTEAAIFAALGELSTHQALGRATGASHAAAICRPDGAIVLVREDVGRHNALDKAIGAMLRGKIEPPCFALLSARCSYELVEKAVRGGLGALVTISAPTTLAMDRAAAAGLPLHVLARNDSFLSERR